MSFVKKGLRRIWSLSACGMALALPVSAWLFSGCFSRPENQRPGKFPEQIVYCRSSGDDIVNAGVWFAPPKDTAKPIAVIWIHGWGVNFYQPTYVQIGRSLAEQGYPCVVGNTRMHDLGNIAAWRGSKKVRAGGYWGAASEQSRDIAAWIDFAEKQGFKKVALVGHSAGWAAVRDYVANEHDMRVAGVVAASGMLEPPHNPPAPDQLQEARRLMDKGEADALIRDPKRSFPSYVSAATILDIANDRGFKTPGWWMKEWRCPVLAFFGTRDDVGRQADLDYLRTSLARETNASVRVETLLIRGTDHMYTGEEMQVAKAIAKWADAL